MHDEEGVHLAKQDVVGLDEIARPCALGVVRKEGGPVLATTPSAKAFDVFLDRAFCDLDAQLEQLAADALGTPEAIPLGHVPDQIDGVGAEARAIPRFRSAAPEETIGRSMPLEDRLGLYNDDGLLPCWEQGGGEEKAEPVAKPKAWPAGATSEHAELVADGCVFEHELASRAAGSTAAGSGANLDQRRRARARTGAAMEAIVMEWVRPRRR